MEGNDAGQSMRIPSGAIVRTYGTANQTNEADAETE